MTENETLPLETATTAPTTAPDVADAAVATPALEPLKPRVGTIVWGSILAFVAVLAIIASQVDVVQLSPAAIVWIVICFGGVIVLAGIVAAVARAATRR